MNDLQRRSPIRFTSKPLRQEVRNFWRVVKQYEGEGLGPRLVDISHKPRWDLQSSRLDDITFQGVGIPPVPGECRLESRFLINRMNRTQAAIWHLEDDPTPKMPAESGYTNVSEATVFLALMGPHIFSITEKLTAVDFTDTSRQLPVLFQGPFSHVPCQLVVPAREINGTGMILLTCSRGYAADMVGAILKAGASFGLHPAGEDRFRSFLSCLVT